MGEFRSRSLLLRLRRVVFLALCVVGGVVGAGEPLHFSRFSTANGLSENGIGAIAEDRQGYLWFGTEDGLNRFDGIEFRIFKARQGAARELVEDYINALHVDRDGRLWIGTFAGGLSVHDPETGRFETFLNDPSDPRSLSGNDVATLYEDRRGSLWVGTRGGGLDRIDPRTRRIERIALRVTGESTAPKQITSIAGTADGTLWIGTLGAGLLQRSPDGALTAERHDPSRADSLPSDNVSALLFDAGGSLWVGTSRSGLALRGPNGAFTHYAHDPQAPDSLAHDAVTALLDDSGGRILVGTALGLDLFDPATHVFSHNQQRADDPFSLPYTGIKTVFRDSIGTLWVGTGGGGLGRHVSPSAEFTVYRANAEVADGLGPEGIWSVLEDSIGRLWVGTIDAGLNYREAGSQEFGKFRHEPDRLDSLSDNDVRALLEESPDRIWVGTRRGLNLLDPRTQSFKRYRPDPKDPRSIAHEYVRALHKDRKDNIWVGTYGGGLDRYLPDVDGFAHLRHRPDDPNSLSDDRVYCLLEDRRGAIWIGTHGGGLNRLDPATGRLTRYNHDPRRADSLASDRVLSLHEDSRGRLWIGTGGGLDLFDPKRERFAVFGNLPSDVVLGIAEDRRGLLWLSTNAGLVRLNPDDGAMRHFPLTDRLLNPEFNGGASFRGPSGRLYFGGVEGLVVVSPDVVQARAGRVVPTLTDFLLFNRSVGVRGVDPESPLVKPIDVTRHITLTHAQRMFGFNFAALRAIDPGRHRFQYRLEGLDDRWIETNSRQRSATFTNVPSGDYTFRVRASDADGAWLPQEAVVGITMLPPPWRSNWAYAGYALAALLVLAIWLRQRRARSAQERQAQRVLADSERRLRLALWGSGDELFDWNLVTGEFARVSGEGTKSRAADNMYSVDNMSTYVHPEDFPGLKSAVAQCLSGTDEQFEVAYRLQRSSGITAWRLARGRAVSRDAEGRALRIVGTEQDISRIKSAEAELIEINSLLDARVVERTREVELRSGELELRQRELESTNERLTTAIEEIRLAQVELVESEKMASLGRLVAGVAHEVNTPLGIGVTAMSFVRDQLRTLRTNLTTRFGATEAEQLTSPIDSASAMAESNLKRAASLVNNFRQVAVDQSASQIRTVGVRDYLDSVLQSLHPVLKQAGHLVELDCDPALQMTTRPDAIYQVLINLVMNSVLHGYPNGRSGTLRIAVAREDAQLRLRYADDGVGMPPEVARRMYEPFFTTRRNAGGTGLGMHITFNLVTQALAGRIVCTTSPGQGVRFEILFPAVHPSFEADPRPSRVATS